MSILCWGAVFGVQEIRIGKAAFEVEVEVDLYEKVHAAMCGVPVLIRVKVAFCLQQHCLHLL